MGAMSGAGDIAYGNAIGSIICNTSLIAAITIAIKPAKANRKTLIFPVVFFFGAAVFYALNAYIAKGFALWAGIILLVGFVAYMIINVVNMKKNPEAEEPKEEKLDSPELAEDKPSAGGLVKDILMLVAGAALIAVGAYLLVESATAIATQLGVPQSVIGLTVVAIGTSLPEFVTAITSLIKGHGSLSLGNIIGANLFNLVLVSGVSVTINPFEVPMAAQLFGQNASLVLEIPLMFAVMALMCLPTLIRGKLSRVQGILLLALYAAFCIAQFTLVQPLA
jgi:cation:H+ antiporter